MFKINVEKNNDTVYVQRNHTFSLRLAFFITIQRELLRYEYLSYVVYSTVNNGLRNTGEYYKPTSRGFRNTREYYKSLLFSTVIM
jgi:hypothetical protein